MGNLFHSAGVGLQFYIPYLAECIFSAFGSQMTRASNLFACSEKFSKVINSIIISCNLNLLFGFWILCLHNHWVQVQVLGEKIFIVVFSL